MENDTAFRLEPFVWPWPPQKDRIFDSLDFDCESEDIFNPPNVVLDTLPMKKLPYGNLFTYCFRRFGNPNAASDGYKDIAAWRLTTPLPEMILTIRPSLCEESHFSIHFAATRELAWQCRAYERRALDAWIARKLDWAESQGLPDWMDSFVEHYGKEMDVDQPTWRDAYVGYISMFSRDSRTALPSDDPRIIEFAAKVASYQQIEPQPEWQNRAPVLADWADDDPLKPLALAAIAALADLSTAVQVRDQAINAFGLVEEGSCTVVNEPASAGYAFGDLTNTAPEECSDLFHVARELGRGNMKLGIGIILEAHKATSEN